MALLEGLISAVYTPFHADGSLRLEIVPTYVDYLVRNQIRGLYICGTTGEGVSLSIEERQAVAEAFVKAADRRIPATVQVGSCAISDCRTLAAHAESIGTDAISANAPSYFRITSTATLADWMIEIASAAPKTPFYYYHIPSFTGVEIDMTEFLSAMESRCPNFAGVKYSDLKGFVFQEAIQYGGGKYEVLWGCDEMLLAGLALGARGGVGSTYAMWPALYHAIIAAFERGDFPEARRLQLESWQFVKILLKYSAVHPSGKLAMRLRGIELGPCRLPFPTLGPDAEANLTADLKKTRFFEQF